TPPAPARCGGAETRTVADGEVGRRLDVRGVEGPVGDARLQGHQDRVGDLVELDTEGVRRRLAVDQAVARHGAVWELLGPEQKGHRVPRGGAGPARSTPGE